MTPAEVFLLLGYFTVFTLAGGFIMDWFEKKNPGCNRGQDK